MTGNIVSLALLLLLVAGGIAAALDLTPDTRDPKFGLGPVLHPRNVGADEPADR
jgi:hypothetical protein